MVILSIVVTFLLVFVLFFDTTLSEAQFEGASSAQLTLFPQYPAPQSTTTISLNAYSLNTDGATIRWFVDGKEKVEDRNKRELDVFVENLGSSRVVRTEIVSDGQIIATPSVVVSPSLVDIIVEADTTIPAFYKGRALPSSGSTVKVIAVPHNLKKDPSAYFYKWEFGDTVLFGGPVSGRRSISLTVPQVSSPLLSLTILDTDGTILTKKNVRLGVFDPELYFYEENPLRSTNRKAIGGTLTLVGNEVTVRTEPYFVDTNVFDSHWVYGWRLDGHKIETGNSNPKLITLSKTGGSGTASVGFELVNTKSLLQNVRGAFQVFFSGASIN